MTNPTHHLEAALGALGGKWKVLIIWHLKDEPHRYGALRKLIGNVTEKMLIRQLRELEQDGIITRKDYQTVPPHVEYSLSEFGQSVLPVLGELCYWGKQYIERSPEIMTTM